MDFDGVSGLESEFIYNGLLLIQRAATATNFTRYKINDIGGFDDADVRDAREVNPARDGEMALPAYYGGRTITFTGKILANNMDQLRRMQQNLRSAFAPLNESTLTIRNSPPQFADPGKFSNVATSYPWYKWFRFSEATGVFYTQGLTGDSLYATSPDIQYRYTPGAITNDLASVTNYAARFNGTADAYRGGGFVASWFPCATNSKFSAEFWYRNPIAPTIGTTSTTILTIAPFSYTLFATGPIGVKFSAEGNKMRFARINPSTVASYVEAELVDTEPTWHHVVGTWNGSTSKIYIDGELAGSVADPVNSAALVIPYSQQVLVGRNTNPAATFCIDELMLFDNEQTESAIRSRYKSGAGVYDQTNFDLQVNARKSAPIQMRESQSGQYPTRDFLITLRASDPRFYSSATNTVSCLASGLATTFAVANDGNANTDPVIKITGPVVSIAGGSNPAFGITNLTTGQLIGMYLPGASMATSASVSEINCSTRRITGSLSYSNLIAGSIFPQVTGGTNTFSVSGLTGTGKVEIIYRSSWI